MSSRVLRKLHLQNDKSEIPCLDDASDTETDLSSSGAKKKQLNINKYDLLNHPSHSESEVKEDDDHETAGSLNAQDGAIDIKDIARRKKKKKKRKSGKISTNARSSEDNVEDEVERSVREVNEILGEVHNSKDTPDGGENICVGQRVKGVLSIDNRCLNANNELRRIFGAKTIHEPIKRKGRSRAHIRSTWMSSPKETWPSVGKSGLSMKLLSRDENGIQYFTYEHSLSYQQTEREFLNAIETLSPDNIVLVINSHPYNVDALLQLSELCRLSEDLSMAAELVERALYCLENAFNPAFTLSGTNRRLEYRRQENRALFIAMFKHLNYVGLRACYRTALEYCKLMFSLDPENDPLAVLLMIDFYALRSQEYDWILRFYTELEPSRNLSQLPNFAYSIALAYFYKGEMELADSYLEKALLNFPGVLRLLLDKCSIQPDSKIVNSPYFEESFASANKQLHKLELLYVARNYHLWKDGELLPWLERASHSVLDKFEIDHKSIEEAKINRAKRYPALPRCILRHIFLSDYKEVTPQADYNSPILSFDPYPPVDSITKYSLVLRSRTNSSESGAFSLLFRTLMPGFDMTNLGLYEGQAEGGAHRPAPADDDNHVASASADLGRSIVSLIDAMSDLFSNMRVPDGDGDAEDDPDSDDEPTPW